MKLKSEVEGANEVGGKNGSQVVNRPEKGGQNQMDELYNEHN